MLTILGLSAALALTIGSFIYGFRGNVELGAFGLAKASFAFMPETYPGNSTSEAQLWRKLFSIGSISIRSYPVMNFTDVQVINELYSPESRLVRIYNPSQQDSNEVCNSRDVIIFYFSGAWVKGRVQDNERLLRNMVLHTGFIVVGIEYSLAPEYPYPRGFDDALYGLRWVKQNIARYGGNPERIFVTGESAGGNLAAAVTLRNLDTRYVTVEDRVNVVGLALVYPPLAANFETESYTKYARYNGVLTKAQMMHAWSLYSGGYAIDDNDYAFQPLYAPDSLLAQLPPTEIMVAEYDVLRDDSLLFAERLRDLSVSVNLMLYNDTIHGFFGRDFSASGDSSVKLLSDRLVSLSVAIPINQQCQLA
eukprot:gene10345-12097_t